MKLSALVSGGENVHLIWVLGVGVEKFHGNFHGFATAKVEI